MWLTGIQKMRITDSSGIQKTIFHYESYLRLLEK